MDKIVQENQSQLAGIINSAMDAIIMIGEDQRIRLFNPAAEKMFQRPAASVLGKPLTMLIPERLRTKHEVDVRSFGKTATTKRSMGRLGMIYGVRADGEEFPLEVSISQSEFEGQKTYSAILRDITERKRAEAQLRESEERFRAMANSAPVLIWVSGTDKLLTWFNRGWLDFVGRTLEQELGNGWEENIHPEDRERCLEIYYKAFDSRQSFKMEYRLRRYDGKWRWVLDSGVPRAEPEQPFSGYIGSCIDITERKQAEEQDREQAKRLKILADVSQLFVELNSDYQASLNLIVRQIAEALGNFCGIWLLSDDGNQLEMAAVYSSVPETQKLIQASEITTRLQANDPYFPQGILQNRYAQLIPGSALAPNEAGKTPENIESYNRILAPIRSRGQAMGILMIARKPDLPDFTLSDLNLSQDLTDRAALAITNARLFNQAQTELAERKRAEVETQRVLAELKRSNQELEQFAYVASHDLQEPLRMVSSYVQLLSRRYQGKLDDDADQFIHYAVDGANRMKALINDLLAFSRVGTRGQELSPVALENILEIVIGNLQMSIEENNAVITHDHLPEVLADDGQMIQLFQNLIANAIKFRSKATPQIHLSAKRQEDQWLFSVSDNGIGIDPQFSERIFVIFQRLHTREEYPGTGIGLSICRKIVERHGGRIWVESQIDQGTTFYFTLPASETTDPADKQTQPAGAKHDDEPG